MEKNLSQEVSENLEVPCEVVLSLKIWEMLLHLLLKVAGNSNQTFWLNGNCPTCKCELHGQ